MSPVALMRRAVAPQAQTRSRDKTLGAPIGGWVTAVNLDEPEPKSAAILENWFPQRRSVRLRGGSVRKATISLSLPTLSLFSYDANNIQKLFAATAGAIYDVTSPSTPTSIPSAAVSGQTSGYYSTALYSTAGGTFLTAVNGTDARQVFDGSAWATTPAITGVTSSTLSHVWVYRNRLFFVQKDTLNAWALPVDSIGGAAIQVSLAGVFQRGGSLLTGFTWSIESGNGLNERCVFVSTNGEAVVFEGTDPSSASTWSKVGTYDIAALLGKEAYLRIAGDVLLMNSSGMVPLSIALNRDPAALALNAISHWIEPDWQAEAVNRPDHWTAVKWPEKNMFVIGVPSGTNLGKYCFVVNAETGAWAKYTNWDTNCLCVFQKQLYFGTSAGTVLQGEVTGADEGVNYTCTYLGNFENWGVEAATKIALLMRSTFIASIPFTPQVSMLANFSTLLPAAPPSAPSIVQSVWDVGLWDQAMWDLIPSQSITTRWRSVYGQGFVMAPLVQVTCGQVNLPDAQLVVNQVKFNLGGIVV